jgi:TP901 family phage tail tape measure protein
VANPIAEAFVLLRPDASSLAAETQRAVDQAVRRVRIPVGAQAGLGSRMFGPAYLDQLERSIQTGVTSGSKNVTVPAATQRTLAQQLFGPGFRNEAGRAAQGALVGLGGGQLAAQFAFFGPAGAAIATTGAALVLAGRQALTFEQSLEILRATTQATEDDIRRAGDAAQELGSRLDLPGISADNAAQAITELAKAGLSLDDSIAGAEGTLRLAIAAQIDTGTAAQIAAAGLNAFSLEGTEAAKVADLLAGSSIAAQGDIGDMALALQQSAAVASQAGLSIEQLVGLITALARQGILGSDAGTSIRTMLLRLVPTTKEASAEMERLGVQLDETRTIGEQLPEVIEQYRRGLALLTPIQRQAALQQIFGTDAIRSATVAFSQGAAGINAATDAANRQGAAAELAEARTRGAAGAFAELRNNAETAALGIGNTFLPVITFTLQGLADLVGGLNTAASGLADFAGTIRDLQDIGGDITSTSVLDLTQNVGEFLDETTRGIPVLDSFFDTLDEGGEVAEKVGGDFDDLASRVRNSIGNLVSGMQSIPQVFRIAESLGIEGAEFARLVQVTRSQGTEAGISLGRSLMEGVAAGITENEQRAIAAARASLADIQREGQQRVLESIRSARANLESLGDSLSQALGDIIDAGPLGDKLEELNAELDALEERTTRRQLRFDTRQAQQDLRDARDAIQQVGVLTPAQRRAQQEFLEPFKKDLADAKVASKEFTLEEAIAAQEELLARVKETSEEGLQKLVDDFEDGRIGAQQFSRQLNNQLGPALDTIRRENLGLSFERGFLRDVDELVQQVKLLAPFIGTAGTTPGVTPISPAATQADVNRQIAGAVANLAQAQRDANTLTKEEHAKLDRMIGLLRRLVEGLVRDTRHGRGDPTRGGANP